ncbi:MAG: hypothetical protein JNM58_01765 [Xanthomonadaceae bacterium]|nr:hypothetical protein [Xanthomonadaceae bacterium]
MTVTAPRTALRLRTPLLATLLLATLPTLAQERIRWPVDWKVGQSFVYETESLERDLDDGRTRVSRSTDTTEVRIAEAGPSGYLQHWITRDSRIETIEGDRSTTDAVAPLLDEFEGFVVQIELGPDGRYRKLRNLGETAAKVRRVMLPITGTSIEQISARMDPDMAPADREMIIAVARRNMEEMMKKFFTDEMIEAMTSGGAKGITWFAGGDYEVGKRYSDAEPIESPLLGRKLPARREFTFTIDKDDPTLARVEWTHTLDTSGDPAPLWGLVSELTAGGLDTASGEGRPKDLALREEGTMLFRRDTGVVEMLENTIISRYGKEHDEHDRNRMRLRGSARAWPLEPASKR